MAVAAVLTPLLPALKDEEKRATAEKAEANPYKANCLDDAAIADLNHLPPTTLLTPIDIGAPLVFWTRHSLVATPHHRNRHEMADTIRAIAGDTAKAEPLARRQPATQNVLYRTATDSHTQTLARNDVLAAHLFHRSHPDK